MRQPWAITFVLILAVAGLLATPALSAPSAVQSSLSMAAEAGFDGYYKYGEWLPVWVELENAGPDLEAEVQVRVTGSWGDTVFAAPASLPSGSRKRIPVYVLPNNFSHVLEVQLVGGGNILRSQEVPVSPQPNITYLAGLVAPERGALTFIGGVSLPGQERPKNIVDLSLADLPERAEGLRSFDCLILNDADTSVLTPEQKAALEGWVRQGGRLVIGGGPGAARTAAGLPEILLPIRPRGEAEVSALPALAEFAGAEAVRVPGPFVVVTGEAAGGRTLIAQAGLPLLQEAVVGAGVVDFVALDLAEAPFDAWTGTTAFWERLLSPGAAYPDWVPPDMSARQMKSGQMTYALSNLPSLDLPSIRGLGLLLVVYVVLVGPVNYLVLRWRNRLHWAWISVPLITLAFSAGAFGVGYALRGTDLILNKVATVRLRSDGSGDVTSYLGLFSPAQQSYEITVMGDSLLSPLNPDYNPWGPGGSNAAGEMVFVQGEPSRVRGLSVNQWSMQTFMTEGRWPDFGTLEGDLQFDENILVGTLRNQTPFKLADAALLLGNRFERLGDLEPYAEVPVRMKLLDPGDPVFNQPLSFRLFQEQLGQPGPTGPPREAELKRLVVEATFDQGGIGPALQAHSGATGSVSQSLALIAWLDQAPPEIQVAGRTPSQQTTALLVAPISYRLAPAGQVSLPPGLLPGALVELPAEGGRCGPQASSVWLGRGDAVFEFQVPEDIRSLEVDALNLLIQSEGGGWWEPPEIALYDWDAEAWVAIQEPVVGLNTIAEAAGLVRADGLVRVRLSSDNSPGSCLYLELGLEGSR
jgi:hypothetical protein